MRNPLLRLGVIGVPVLVASLSAFVACSETAIDTLTVDASADGQPDGPSGFVDGGGTDATVRDSATGADTSTGTDATTNDSGGLDAGPDAFDAGPDVFDAGPPTPLCDLYPNDNDPNADGGSQETPPATRYNLLGYRVLHAAEAACEFGGNGGHGSGVGSGLFVDLFTAPFPADCLGQELAFTAGCKFSGIVPVYETEGFDTSGTPCVTSGGGPESVFLGFRNPTTLDAGGYTRRDVQHFLTILRAEAIKVGFSTPDADRLVALMAARASVVLAGSERDAAAPDSGFTSNTCP